MLLRHKIYLLMLFSLVIAGMNVYWNADALLYKGGNIVVELSSGNHNFITISRKKNEKYEDFSRSITKNVKDGSVIRFSFQFIPLKNIKLESLRKDTRIKSAYAQMAGEQQKVYFTDNHLKESKEFSPFSESNKTFNYKGNLFLLQTIGLRTIVIFCALLICGIAIKIFWGRYFFPPLSIWITIILISKLGYLYKLDVLQSKKIPFVLAFSLFNELFFFVVALILIHLKKMGRFFHLCGAILIIVLSLNLTANLIHFYFTNENLNFDNLRFVSFSAMVGVISFNFFITIVVLVSLLGYSFYYYQKRPLASSPTSLARYCELLFIGLFSLVISHFVFPAGKIKSADMTEFHRHANHQRFHFVIAPLTLESAKNFFHTFYPKRLGLSPLSEEDTEALKELSIIGKENSSFQLTHPPKKIILIAAEALSINLINHYNNSLPKEVTPFLNSLLDEYPHLDNFFTARSPTLYGMMSLLASHLDIETATIPGYQTLPKVLNENGFRNILIHSCDEDYAQYDYYFRSFGFSNQRHRQYFEKKYPGSSKNFGWGFTDDILFKEAVDILKAATPEEKVFITILTIDTHSPGGRFRPDIDVSHLKKQPNPYFFSLYSLDFSLKEFLGRLEAENLLDDETLIILTADHSAFLDINYIGIDGVNKDEVIQRIPAIFVTGNKMLLNVLKDYQDTFASQIDLAPSILGLLNINKPVEMLGKNIFTIPGKDYAITMHRGVMQYISPFNNLAFQINRDLSVPGKETAITKWYLNRSLGKKWKK